MLPLVTLIVSSDRRKSEILVHPHSLFKTNMYAQITEEKERGERRKKVQKEWKELDEDDEGDGPHVM